MARHLIEHVVEKRDAARGFCAPAPSRSTATDPSLQVSRDTSAVRALRALAGTVRLAGDFTLRRAGDQLCGLPSLDSRKNAEYSSAPAADRTRAVAAFKPVGEAAPRQEFVPCLALDPGRQRLRPAAAPAQLCGERDHR
jgi:hypothetical protein